MKNNYSKLDTIKDLVARGMSFAVAIALAGTMTACDPTNLPDDELPSDTPGVSDTVAPDSSETTTPNSSETENEETATEPKSSESENETIEDTETQPIEPELSDEDKAFLQGFYQELAQFDERYAEGIGNIKLNIITNEMYGVFTDDNKNDVHHYTGKIAFSDSENTFGKNAYAFTLSADEGIHLINLAKQYFNVKEYYNSLLIQTSEFVSESNPMEFYKKLDEILSALEQEQE